MKKQGYDDAQIEAAAGFVAKDEETEELYCIPGFVPNPIDMPDYCYFRDRCEMHCERCSGLYPPEIKVSDTHVVSCYRYYDEGEVLDYPKSVNVEEL